MQASLSLQLTAVPRQRPPLQWSPTVHALASEQSFESLGVPMHAPPSGSQASSVQLLPSSQPLVAPATHAPPLQEPSAQALSSEQLVPLIKLGARH